MSDSDLVGARFPEFAQWFRDQLARRGVSQTQFTDRSGIGQANVNRYYNGRNVPNLDNARKLATEFDVPVVDVVLQAGLMSPEDLNLSPGVVRYGIEQFSIDELLGEVRRRVVAAESGRTSNS